MTFELECFEEPTVQVLGKMVELTGSGGNDNGDGWGYDNCAR